MGKVVLCSGEIAKEAYYLEEVNIKVWSIEELAYVIVQNAIIWDESLVKEALVDWIRIECALPEFKKEFKSKDQFILELVVFLGFYSEEEREQLKEKLETGENIPKTLRKKMRADLFVAQNKLDMAVVEYSKLLKEVEADDVVLKSQLLHNQGVAYCRMFQFLLGAKCFYEGYTIYPTVESFEQYLFALRLHMPETEYINYIDKQGIEMGSTLEIEQSVKQAMSVSASSEETASLNELIQLHDDMEFTTYLERVEEKIESAKQQYRG